MEPWKASVSSWRQIKAHLPSAWSIIGCSIAKTWFPVQRLQRSRYDFEVESARGGKQSNILPGKDGGLGGQCSTATNGGASHNRSMPTQGWLLIWTMVGASASGWVEADLTLLLTLRSSVGGQALSRRGGGCRYERCPVSSTVEGGWQNHLELRKTASDMRHSCY
jgi:hypothetical protein